MKVDFVVRSDARTKSGGDSQQIADYRRGLEALGVDVREVPFGPRMSLRSDAIVHVVNIDRPFDFLEALGQARDRPVVVSPIHHELRTVRRMRRAETGRSPRALLARCLPPTMWELCTFVWRSVRQRPRRAALGCVLRACGRTVGVWRRVGIALDGVAAVQLLAVGEGRNIARDTGWLGRNGIVVPNGLPAGRSASGRHWASREIGVVVVGRIEPRKRQVAVMEAALERGIEITFAGALSASSSAYGETFTRLAARPGMHWRGPLSHEGTLDLMRDARVLLNASWVEVQSLVDLEAASCGCHVVCMAAGSSKEWLGDAVIEVDGDVEIAVERAAELATSARAPTPTTYDQTWDACARALRAVYANLCPSIAAEGVPSGGASADGQAP